MSAPISRCHTATSSESSTPRLSPYLESTEWTRNTSSNTTDTYSTDRRPFRGSVPTDSARQEWWEHVLPPGQLAERLRKAQRSSSASRRRNNPALANATPSERSAWKRLSGLPSEHELSDKSNSSAMPTRRASLKERPTWHASSSVDISSDENASASGHRSLARNAGPAVRHSASSSRQHSPEQSSTPWLHSPSSSFHSPPMSRSTSSRRCRISSEEGSHTSTHSTSHTTLPRSSSATQIPYHFFGSVNAAHFAPHSLPDTPEISSDENTDSRGLEMKSVKQRKQRLAASSVPRGTTPHTILRSSFNHLNQPIFDITKEEDIPGAHHREKHVSFGSATVAANETGRTFASHAAFEVPSSDPVCMFETSLPRSNGTRRARQGVRINGRKTSSFSLPGSRRSSLHDESQHVSPQTSSFSSTESKSSYTHSTSMSDAALLDSLNVAHKQLASAGNLALTLTRQLSAPLRPVFHLTLFFSISSITVASLACFLFASYMLTAWDDFHQRSQSLSRVAVQTKTKIESSLGWGIGIVGTADSIKRSNIDSASSAPTSDPQRHTRSKSEPFDTSSGEAKRRTASTRSSKASDVVFWPMRLALTGAGTIAHRVTPSPIAGIFTASKDSAASSPSTSASSRPSQRKNGSSLPPRPPLSLLLPSIMFTLVIAIGAGLTSFFASRQATSESTHASPAHSRSSSPGASSTFVHVPASYSKTPLSSPVVRRSYFPHTAVSHDQFLRPRSAK